MFVLKECQAFSPDVNFTVVGMILAGLEFQTPGQKLTGGNRANRDPICKTGERKKHIFSRLSLLSPVKFWLHHKTEKKF